MKCSACAQALNGLADMINASCMSCAARQIARSDEVRIAMDKDRSQADRIAATEAVRVLIGKLIPRVPYEVARREVLVWWRIGAPVPDK